MGAIYMIINSCNNKVYIGQTTRSAKERFSDHMKDYKYSKNKSKLYSAIRELGANNFSYRIIEDNVPNEKLIEREMHYIEVFNSCNNGYNTRKGGKGGRVFSFSEIGVLITKAKNGVSAVELAKEHGVHVETVYRALHDFGYRYQNTDDERIREEFYSGKTLKEISEICNVNPRTVTRHLRKMGLFRRKATNDNV